MEKFDNVNIFDFGHSNFRLGNYDVKFPNNKNTLEKTHECFFNLDIKNENLENLIHQLIKNVENKSSNYIDSINLMIDTSDLLLIDLAIKKNFEGKKINYDDLNFLINDAKALIKKNYQDRQIIHTIVQKHYINNNLIHTFPSKELKCDSLILELKFMCITNYTINNLNKVFKKNNIEIKKFYNSSYIKSSNYNSHFTGYDKKFFLDIGYKKTCLTYFEKDKLIFMKIIPVGGNHITNDISKVLKIDFTTAEKIKINLNQSNVTFSDETENEQNLKINIEEEFKEKISFDLLKKVIYARIDEILNLIFIDVSFKDLISDSDKSILVFTGYGSKILDKNSIYLKEEFDYFNEINLFNESCETICQSGFNFPKNNFQYHSVVQTKYNKTGFFEKLFNYLS